MKPYVSEPINATVPAVAAIELDLTGDVELDSPCRALYVGTQGDVDVVMMDGQEITFIAVLGILPVRVREIKSTSTAEDVVALY